MNPWANATQINRGSQSYGYMQHLEDFAKLPPSESPTGSSWGGLPYYGKKLNSKNSDNPLKQPRKKLVAHCKIFNMEDEKDMEEYATVMQSVANGLAIPGAKEILKISSPLRIYLEWYDQIYVDPVEN